MRRLLSPIALALLGLASTPALAAERHWTFIGGCGSADWFGKTNGPNAEGQTTCWGVNAAGGSGLAVPTAADAVFIQHAHASLDLANTFSTRAIGEAWVGRANSLSIAGVNGRYASLAVDRHRLEVTWALIVGDKGLGKFFQSAGTVEANELALGRGAGAVGVYALSGGVLNAGAAGAGSFPGLWLGWAREDANKGGKGQFVQTGGTLNANAVSIVEPGQSDARTGSFFDLSGGQAVAGWVGVGSDGLDAGEGIPSGAGRLRIAGSAVMKADGVGVAATGLLELQGGRLEVSELNTRTENLVFTDGVLRFYGSAKYGFWNGEGDGGPLPLAFGGGLGGGTPTVQLAAEATLSLPSVHVGDFGQARLEVEQNAKLTTDSASIGTSRRVGLVLGTGEGWVVLRGPGAEWVNRGLLSVGTKGFASLEVSQGAKLVTGSAALGDGDPLNAGHTNLAHIHGAGSAWQNTGDLWLGGGATGPGRTSLLWLSEGALLQVGGRLHVHAGSRLLAVGSVWAAERTVNEGSIEIASDREVQLAGSLSLRAGSGLITSAPLTFLGAVEVAAGARIDSDQPLRFEGSVLLQPGAVLVGEGTRGFAGELLLRGEFVDSSANAPVVFASTNTLIAGIGGAAPGSFGRYVSQGPMQLGGTLVLAPRQGYQGLPGDTFDLLDGTLSGSFDRIDTSSFALAPGLRWDFSRLNAEGVVSLSAAPIPEPGTWALWLAGLAGLSAMARRRRPAV